MEEEKVTEQETETTEPVTSTVEKTDEQIQLEAQQTIINELKESNQNLVDQINKIKKEQAELSLRFSVNKPDDGEIFGAFNRRASK